MGDSIGPPSRSSIKVAEATNAHFLGSGIVGGVEWFVNKFGPAAAHTAVTKLSPHHRVLIQPHATTLGILGAKRYTYPFIGDLLRAMAAAVRLEEDVFVREFTAAGIDHTLRTVNRVILRLAANPHMVAARAQELWNMFHTAGRITILSESKNEYLSQLSDWPDHDVTVCKMCMEARRRIVERTGAREVEVRREKCQAWGHEVCCVRVRWR